MKKITFITPARIIRSPRDGARGDMGVPHPGVLSLIEFLLSHKVDATILDLNALPEKGSEREIVDYLAKETPDVVGITALTCNYPQMCTTAEIIRKTDPEIKIIAGGCHVSLNYEQIINSEDSKLFDFLVVGEGERVVLELMQYFAGRKGLNNIRGICYKDKTGSIIKTPPVKLMAKPSIIRDAWRLLNIPLYAKGKKGLGLSFNTMRGCYGRCSFCSEPLRWPGVSMMSAEDIVAQIAFLKENYNPDYVFMADSNFNISTARIEAFIRLMKEHGLYMPFIFEGRADKIWEQRKLLPQLREVGAFVIFFGGERMDETGLKYLGKSATPDLNEKAARAVHESGIGLKTTFIFGLPPDTEESMKTLARLVQEKIQPEIPSFASYTPIPGTFEHRKNHTYIRVHDFNYYTFNNSVCNTDYLDYREVHDIINHEWFAYWAREENRTRFLNHPNEATRKFGKVYYDYLETRSEYQATRRLG